jgi:hypothetical protein
LQVAVVLQVPLVVVQQVLAVVQVLHRELALLEQQIAVVAVVAVILVRRVVQDLLQLDTQTLSPWQHQQQVPQQLQQVVVLEFTNGLEAGV